MKKLLFSLMIILLFSLPSLSSEDNEIIIESGKTTIITLKKIKKYTLSNPNIAKITHDKDMLKVKGTSLGESQLYIWTDKEFYSYFIVTTSTKLDIEKKYYIASQNNLNQNITRGSYSMSTGTSINNTRSIQNMTHNLKIDYPIDKDNHIKINGNINLNSNDITNIQFLNLQNITFNYKGKEFSGILGDFGFNSKYLSINNLRGLNLEYDNKINKISVFSGFNQNPLFFYKSKDYNQNTLNNGNLYYLGLSDLFRINDRIDINNTILYSIRDINDISKNRYNLSSDLKLRPIDNLSINTSVVSDFNDVSLFNTNLYKYKFNDNENIQVQTSFNHVGNNSFFNSNRKYNSFQISANGSHRSDLNVYSSLSQSFFENDDKQSSAFFKVDKTIIPKSLNAYGSYTYENIKLFDRKIINIGINNNLITKSSLNYRYTQTEKNNNTIFRHDLLTSLRILNIENLSSLLNINLGLSNEEQSIKNNINFTTSLVSDFKINKDLSIGLSNSYMNLSFNNSYYQSLINVIRTNYKFMNTIISLNLTFENNLTQLNRNSFNALMSYTYNFNNNSIDDLKGSISGKVFEDLNDNQIYDNGEKIFDNVKIIIKDKIVITDSRGFNLNDIDYDDYEITIDENTLPKNYKVIDEKTKIVELNSENKEINFPVQKQNIIKGKVYSDLRASNTISNIRILLDNREEELTDVLGSFSFKTSEGKHIISIDKSSIPENYILSGKTNIEVNALDEEIEFKLSPVIYLKAQLDKKINDKVNIHFKNKYIEYNKEIDVNSSSFYLFELEEGHLEISSKSFDKLYSIEIPNLPNQLKLNIKVK